MADANAIPSSPGPHLAPGAARAEQQSALEKSFSLHRTDVDEDRWICRKPASWATAERGDGHLSNKSNL